MAQINLQDPLLGSHRPERKTRLEVVVVALTIAGAVAAVSLCYAYYGHGFAGEISWEEITSKKPPETGDVVESEVGVVAADDSRCSAIGVSVLKEGGHAVDAAVATVLCLGVVNSMSSGIGGGGFMVVRDGQTGRAEAYNFRETAPLTATLDFYQRNPRAKHHGPLSLCVPGEIAGLHAAWLQHGRIPWRSLFKPSIKLARDGFVVAPCLAGILKSSNEAIMADPGLRRVFAPGGELLEAGDVCYNTKLSDTLEVVAEQGPGAFYNGSVGENLTSDVRAAGGILTMDDLRQYQVEVTEAIRVDVMGYTIVGMAPPSAGTVGVSLILKVIESYGSIDAIKGPLGLHRFIESLKHMLAVRMDLGDPNFVNVTDTVMAMLSSSFAQQIRREIVDNTTFPAEYYGPKWSQLRDHGTSHVSIVDGNRNAVSLTSTVNTYFGAEMVSPSTGILLNNEMDDFSIPTEKTVDGLPPPPSNFIQPNKRPLSSMTPIVILKDDQLAGVLGGSGGLFITPAVIQVFLNHFILGMEPLDAILKPRVYHLLTPNLAFYENITAINGDHIELQQESGLFLEERGHHLVSLSSGASCQLVVHDLKKPEKKSKAANKGQRGVYHGILTAVSDPRKDGKAAGI
ncbi:glutathione hydrolase 3-like [Aristolochia californica]|uniref:glutathione hydrolase 3-like n=1 Tax=Aristolochia californica TaxID=171875 RepID=UPI0035DFEB12